MGNWLPHNTCGNAALVWTRLLTLHLLLFSEQDGQTIGDNAMWVLVKASLDSRVGLHSLPTRIPRALSTFRNDVDEVWIQEHSGLIILGISPGQGAMDSHLFFILAQWVRSLQKL